MYTSCVVYYVSIASAESIAPYYVDSGCLVSSKRFGERDIFENEIKNNFEIKSAEERKKKQTEANPTHDRDRPKPEQKCMTTAPEWQSEYKLKPKHFRATLSLHKEKERKKPNQTHKKRKKKKTHERIAFNARDKTACVLFSEKEQIACCRTFCCFVDRFCCV